MVGIEDGEDTIATDETKVYVRGLTIDAQIGVAFLHSSWAEILLPA